MNLRPPPNAAPLLIRRAEAEDAPAIAELYRELVADPQICVLPEQVAAMAASGSSFLLVAEVEESICATALLILCPDAMYGAQPFGVVENIVVARAMRGHGVGRQLMEHMELLAIAADCTKLMLLSSAARTAAHAFFRSCGFASDAKLGFVKYRRQFAAE